MDPNPFLKERCKVTTLALTIHMHRFDACSMPKNGFVPYVDIHAQPPPPWIFKLVGLFGLLVQYGVLAYAGLVTHYLRWDKDGLVVPRYGFLVFTSGSLLLSMGMFLCACLIETSTKERIFRKRPDSKRMSFYWIQPGNQVIGDQAFDSFAYSDSRAPLAHYITSYKSGDSTHTPSVWLTVVVSMGSNSVAMGVGLGIGKFRVA